MQTGRHVVVDIMLGSAVATAIVLGLAVLLGAGREDSKPDGAAPSAAALGPAALTAEVGCLVAPLVAASRSGIAGQGQVCSIDGGIRIGLAASALTPGTLYAGWLLYFDRPAACRERICTDADLDPAQTAAVAIRMDATVADGSRHAVLWGDARGILLVRPAQLMLALVSHGPAAATDGAPRHRLLFGAPPGGPFARLQLGGGGDGPGLLVGAARWSLE